MGSSLNHRGSNIPLLKVSVSNVCHEWVDSFKDLKTFKPPAKTAIKQVLAFYSHVIPKSVQAQRKGWSHVLGYRKHSKDGLDRGERKIENCCLSGLQSKLFAKKAGL